MKRTINNCHLCLYILSLSFSLCVTLLPACNANTGTSALSSIYNSAPPTSPNSSATTFSSSDSGNSGYATIKYDSHGDELWTARYDLAGNIYQGNALTIDNDGNTYVTGLTTVKYDQKGKQIWAVANSAPASAIGVDGSGNVFVAGNNGTTKYDINGNKLWEGNDPGHTRSLALDKSGNVFVTGWGGSQSPAVYKYDTNGHKIWAWIMKYSGETSSIFAMALDQSDNAYVTGYAHSATLNDNRFLTIMLDSAGNQVWEANYDGTAKWDNVAYGVAVDGSGNVYVTGRSFGTGTHYDFATIKYDASGREVWVARYDDPASGDDTPNSIGLDSKGNVYVNGSSERSLGKRDYATVKYDTNGKQLWAARYTGQESGADNLPFAFAVDPSGDCYVTGRSIVSVNYANLDVLADDYYATVKYNAEGNELWVMRYKRPGSGFNEAYGLAVDANGNVFVSGVSGPPQKLVVP